MELFASSHGRELIPRILEEVPYSSCIFKPNAKFQTVTLGIENVPPGKPICIIGGTNNTHDPTLEVKTILSDFNIDLIKNKNKTNPIIIVEILKRFDCPKTNALIAHLNMKIKKIFRHHKNIKFVPTRDLDCSLYTRQGLHLNNDGKDVLAKRIAETYYSVAQ